jgi:hypothetical protein
MPAIVNYITSIIVKFKDSKHDVKSNLREYLDNIFIKNIDIWGFINCYYPFLEMLSGNYNILTPKQQELFDQIKGLFINYLYLSPDSAINLSGLFSDLTKIKQILYEIVHLKTTTYSTMTKSSTTRSSTSKSKQFNVVANGIKTRKNKKVNKIFRRKPKQRRFKNPFFL